MRGIQIVLPALVTPQLLLASKVILEYISWEEHRTPQGAAGIKGDGLRG
jgi:hypothetical protein